MQYDTTLSENQLKRTVQTIEPAWRVREVFPVELGHHIVYRLDLETPGGDRSCVLKATPKGKDPSVNLEARIMAILEKHTRIPVPKVHGVVDNQDNLPAPYMITDEIPGEIRFRRHLVSYSDDFLWGIARNTGRYLAELHALEAITTFGFLTHDGPDLHGDRPSGDFDTIRVVDPVENWKDRCRESARGTLEDIEQTRFADVVPAAEPVVEAGIAELGGSFEPVLARIDQSLEQIVMNEGVITALLDWEFTIASTAADDVVNVTRSLAGGPYLFAPDVPDRRDLIREALLEGYTEHGNRHIVDDVRENRDCYELLSTLRSMVHLESWFQSFDLGDQIEPAAKRLRDELATRL